MLWNIYKHTNKINNWSYVGRTAQKPTKRWGKNGQGYKKQAKFWNAIQKYGWDNFTHEIVAWVDNEELAIAEEIYQKIKYDTIANGYNVMLGEGPNAMLGKTLSKDKKRVMSEEHKIKISKANKGQKRSLEHVAKQSERQKGKFAGQNNPFFGKTHTEATKEILRQKNIGKFVSEETRAKQRAAAPRGENHHAFGKKLTEECKQKISENHANVSGSNNPNYGQHWSDEWKQEQSQRMKNNRKFDQQDIRRIRQEISNGKQLKEIAKEFGVDPSVISNIKHGKSYSDL